MRMKITYFTTNVWAVKVIYNPIWKKTALHQTFYFLDQDGHEEPLYVS